MRRIAKLFAVVLMFVGAGVACGGDSGGGASGTLVSEVINETEGELATISGQVRDGTGPVESVAVRFVDPEGGSDDWAVGGVTDSTGAFAFELEAGDYQLRFDANKAAGLARTFYPDRAVRADAGTLTVGAGQEAVLIVELEAEAAEAE